MSNDRVPKDFKDRLEHVAENTGNKTDRALAELLYGYYPNLNHKEFAVCRTIADTLWDLGGRALQYKKELSVIWQYFLKMLTK